MSMFSSRAPSKMVAKGHPPKTALEKDMVALMKKHDLKTISAKPNKGK